MPGVVKVKGSVAVPPTRFTVLRVVVPSLKVTEPVGVPAPGWPGAAATVAVSIVC